MRASRMLAVLIGVAGEASAQAQSAPPDAKSAAPAAATSTIPESSRSQLPTSRRNQFSSPVMDIRIQDEGLSLPAGIVQPEGPLLAPPKPAPQPPTAK